MRNSSIFLIFFCGLMSIICPPIHSQTTPTEFADTVFIELILNDEGVIAIDTFGNDWYYDFNAEQFILGENRRGIEGRSLDNRRDESDLPVEERCTEERIVKTSMSSVLIGYDEFVDGDILAVGRVTVKGWVRGNVSSMSGRVLVSSSGQVDGDIKAPAIKVKDGGVVLGKEIITYAPDFDDITSTFSGDGVIVISILTTIFLLVVFLIISLMPRQFSNFSQCIDKNKLKTTALGFLLLIFMPFVVLLVGITLVGLVLIPVVLLLYITAMIMGMATLGNKIGQNLSNKLLGQEKNIMFQSLVGLTILMIAWLVTMVLIGTASETANVFGWISLAIVITISCFPVFSGIGAAFLTRFGFKIYTSMKEKSQFEKNAPTPAPPPIPSRPQSFSRNNSNIIPESNKSNNPTPPLPPMPPGAKSPDDD